MLTIREDRIEMRTMLSLPADAIARGEMLFQSQTRGASERENAETSTNDDYET